jgi:AcrR family transcriptional regulator
MNQPNADRRNPLAHKAILKATLELLRKTPYSSLTIEAIAARAGVGKATIYRWWPSKGALVVEALTASLVIKDPPETSDLRQDLVASMEIWINNYLKSRSADLLIALAADASHDPALLASLTESFIRPRREAVGRLLQQGIDDGQLPANLDPELVMDMWMGALLYRGLFKHVPIGDDLAAQLVDNIMGL